jgi:HPr kinase/phosphorylase
VRVHATAIAVVPPDAPARAALIRGPSGAGKSDLALRCLCQAPSFTLPWPCRLVGDDQVALRATSGTLVVAGVASIAGQLEVRGLGIVDVGALSEARVRLVVDLVDSRGEIERLPDDDTVELAGCRVRRLTLYPFEPSAVVKVLLALMQLS